MSLSLVFPMFWGRESSGIYEEGDHFYDHPTALDDEGTIPPLFESMKLLADRDFDVIAVAGASHPFIEREVETAARSLLQKHAAKAGVTVHFFCYSHLERLHAFFREIGKEDLSETIALVGYSPLRNACLVAAHILGREIAVSIDDDCVFNKSDYVSFVKDTMLTEFEGRPITALCGPYITAQDAIYLPPPAAPHTVYWNVIEIMNEAFRRFIVEAPGKKEVPFAIMGNIAVHRDFFTRCPLDPPLQRGEDSDWVMNAHILGERFIMDPEFVIKHCPPPRPHPAWRPMREDIYRFRYQQAKISGSRDGDGYHQLRRERYLPFPGGFYQDDFDLRVTNACQLLAMDYLIKGESENAKETLANIHHAHTLALPKTDPFKSYIDFQKRWEEMMGIIDERREEVRNIVFG